MRNFTMFLTCSLIVFSLGNLFSQNTDTLINDIRIKYKTINDSLSTYSKVFNEEWDYASEGTDGYAFYDNNDLKLIKVGLYGETGRKELEYYFHNDVLFFAFVTDYSYNRPIYYTGEDVTEGDEAFDPNKTVKNENRYYFFENKMIRWLDSKKNQVPSSKPGYKEKGEGIFEHAELLKLRGKKTE